MPGVVLGGLHGSAGNATFVRTPYGVSLRDRTAPRNPRTPAQQSARSRMARASRTWKSLAPEQAQAWREYAASLPVAAGAAAQHPQNVFCKLATKFLQVSPNGEIPLVPPVAPFGGDAVAISVTSIAGALRYSSSGANGAGVTTELLLQPLASVHRRAYAKEYRTRGFHQFTSASSFDVLVPHGVYACAVRFVQVATGLDGGILELGVVEG